LDWNWDFDPGFVVEGVSSNPDPNEISSPMKSAPEVIEVEDDEDEEEEHEEEHDEIDEHDDYSDNSDVAEVHHISSDEDEDSVQGIGTTRDLIGNFLPAAEYGLETNRTQDEVEVEDMTDELAAAELPIQNEPEEVTDIAENEGTDISAEKENAFYEGQDELEAVSLDDSKKSDIEVNEGTKFDFSYPAAQILNCIMSSYC
jgi:hypothetical protein